MLEILVRSGALVRRIKDGFFSQPSGAILVDLLINIERSIKVLFFITSFVWRAFSGVKLIHSVLKKKHGV